MIKILIIQFYRTKKVFWIFCLVTALSIVAAYNGKKSNQRYESSVNKTKEYFDYSLNKNLKFHSDDLGLLMYYQQFPFVFKHNKLAVLNTKSLVSENNIHNVTIRAVQAQLYDTEYYNPNSLVLGNFDFKFLVIFIFPLLIIYLFFDIVSIEKEKKRYGLLLNTIFFNKYILIRFLLIYFTVFLLFIFSLSITLVINSFVYDSNLLLLVLVVLLYFLLWSLVCLLVNSIKKSSIFNISCLVIIWSLLAFILPGLSQLYAVTKYKDYYSYKTFIKQRDAYHTKWDTDKTKTLNAFYKQYPQFSVFGIPNKSFSWTWYYAMQNAGDSESKQSFNDLSQNIINRDKLVRNLSLINPLQKMQLVFDDLTCCSVMQFQIYKEKTINYHKDLRLYFYPKIFSEYKANKRFFDKYKLSYYSPQSNKTFLYQSLIVLTIYCCILFIFSFFLLKTKLVQN